MLPKFQIISDKQSILETWNTPWSLGGCENNTGDGAGILPFKLLRNFFDVFCSVFICLLIKYVAGVCFSKAGKAEGRMQGHF